MIHWLKQRLAAWVEKRQRHEIARLQQEAMRLKQELERTTGEPVRLTQAERELLADKARGIDPETLKQISVLDPDALIDSTDSTENPYASMAELEYVFQLERRLSFFTLPLNRTRTI